MTLGEDRERFAAKRLKFGDAQGAKVAIGISKSPG